MKKAGLKYSRTEPSLGAEVRKLDESCLWNRPHITSKKNPLKQVLTSSGRAVDFCGQFWSDVVSFITADAVVGLRTSWPEFQKQVSAAEKVWVRKNTGEDVEVETGACACNRRIKITNKVFERATTSNTNEYLSEMKKC